MMAREFTFVPFGAAAPEGAAGCDGLVAGAALDLSHWPKNKTPPEYKADTSVEIALAFVRDHGTRGPSRVVNNHFDTDGLLAVWTLLCPEEAWASADLIIAAAEAGDFDEWPKDPRGLWLDAALKRLVSLKPEASAYPIALGAVGEIVRTIDSREDLWGRSFEALQAAEQRARAGDVVPFAVGAIQVFHHGPGIAEAPGPVLSRLGAPEAPRILLAFEEPDGRFRYRYELPRWTWADTVRRQRLRTPVRNALALGLGPSWALKGGDLGLTGLLRTKEPIREGPREIAKKLMERERFAV